MALTIKMTANGCFRVQHYRQRPTKQNNPTTPLKESNGRNYKAESLSRAKRTIIDYADNNDFNYFITFTFDQTKIDRQDGRLLYEKVKSCMKYYKRFYCPDLIYLLVPEQHQDGCYHFHGLCKIPDIVCNDGSTMPPPDLTKHYDRIKHCYYWRSNYFFERFGAVRFDSIFANSIACSRYISKYITKETEKAFPLTYLCSRGLKTSTILWHSDYDSDSNLLDVIFDYESDTAIQQLTADGILKPPFKNDFVTSFEFDGETAFQFFTAKLLQYGWHCDIIPSINGTSLCNSYTIVSPDGVCYK